MPPTLALPISAAPEFDSARTRSSSWPSSVYPVGWMTTFVPTNLAVAELVAEVALVVATLLVAVVADVVAVVAEPLALTVWRVEVG